MSTGGGPDFEARVRQSLDHTVQRSFYWTTMVLGLLFTSFILLDRVSLEPPANQIIPVLDAIMAFSFFGLHLLFRVGLVPDRAAHGIGFLAVALGVINGVVLIRVTQEPLQTLSLLVALVGAMVLFLSWPWFLGGVVLIDAAWIGVVTSIGWSEMWIQYGLAMMTATGLGVVVHLIRYNTYHRLESLRLHDQAQKEVLAGSLQAAQSAEAATRLAVERLVEIERLKEVNRFRTEFINGISHELNNPLTPLRIQAEILASDLRIRQDPTLRRSLDIVQRNVDRLSALVVQMLESARLQSGLAELRLQTEDLARLKDLAFERWRPRFHEKGILLRSEASPPVHVRADPARIQQVLDALLQNALRHTPPDGEVEIGTGRVAREGIAWVRDSGTGIAREDLPRLFQPFSRVAPGSVGTARTGAGLGLYLSRVLIEMQGGRIEARSEGRDQGAEFRFSLPVVS